MYFLKRSITIIFFTLLSIGIVLSAVFTYMVVTPLGGKILVHYFKQEFFSVGYMHVGHFDGSLQHGFTLKDIRVTGLSYLPNAIMRIQEIRVSIPWWDPFDYDCNIFNARLFIPDSDPVVFTGRVRAGQIQGNIYSNSVDIYEVSRFWMTDDIKRNLQGFFSNLDGTVGGTLFSPHVSGRFLADNIRYRSILITEGSSTLDLTFTPAAGQVQVRGEVVIKSGLVNVRKKNLQLSESQFIFKGDVFEPILNIHLGAKVEDMDIHLTIKGSSLNPELTVSSDPPMPPEDALRVLFTGNAWSSSTSPFNSVTSSQLAEDFLNYSLENMDNNQQFGFKTKLTDNLKLGAEMDQMSLPAGETNTYYSRKVNGEMDFGEHMSFNVSQEVLAQDSYPSFQDTQPEDETQFYLQYKKRF